MPLRARTRRRFKYAFAPERTPAHTTFRIKKETKVKTRTVSRRVRHVRQLTVPVVLGFHQRPSVQFAGFQFNLIIIRRKKVVSVQFYTGPHPPKHTLSMKKKKKKKIVSPTSKRPVSFSAYALPLFPSIFYHERTTRRRTQVTKREKIQRRSLFSGKNRTERFHHINTALTVITCPSLSCISFTGIPTPLPNPIDILVCLYVFKNKCGVF
jgi:hypothetical protein